MNIDESESGDDSLRISYFANGMAMLIGVRVGMKGEDAPSSVEVDDFRAQVESLLIANRRSFFSYLYRSMDLAIRSPIEGWYEPCLRRSAIQLVLDDYPKAAEVLDSEDRETVEEIDEWLRDRAPEISRLPDSVIPHEMPASHWWWRLPSMSAKSDTPDVGLEQF
ncbi:hypothetical protein ACWIGI_13135 [Nocardia sp. NPDC055321]